MPEYWYEEWMDRNRVNRRVEITIESEPKPLWWGEDTPEPSFPNSRPHQYRIRLIYYADGKKDGTSSHGTYDTYGEALALLHKDFPRAIKDWKN